MKVKSPPVDPPFGRLFVGLVSKGHDMDVLPVVGVLYGPEPESHGLLSYLICQPLNLFSQREGRPACEI